MSQLRLRRALDEKRSDVAKMGEVQGGVFQVYGSVDLTGIGGTTVEVNFPVTFLEEPNMVFGYRFGTNQAVVDGTFPRLDAAVVRYVEVKANDESPRYRGAFIMVYVSAEVAAEQFLTTFNWLATGRALVNPIKELR